MGTISADTTEVYQSLAAKLATFDAGLTPAERMVFRARLLMSMPDADVHGHGVEIRWQPGPTGLFFQWVSTESAASEGGESAVDPLTWNTFNSRQESVENPNHARTSEETARS